MKNYSANRFLRSAEPEALGGGGSVAAPAETPAAAAAPAAEEAKPPGLLEQVRASLQSKGTLLADRSAALTRAELAEGQLEGAQAELTTLRAENATLKAERDEISALLSTAKAEKQEVDLATAVQVAGLGFDAAALPAAEVAPAETRAGLVAQIEKETDNNKRWELTERLEALNAESN